MSLLSIVNPIVSLLLRPVPERITIDAFSWSWRLQSVSLLVLVCPHLFLLVKLPGYALIVSFGIFPTCHNFVFQLLFQFLTLNCIWSFPSITKHSPVLVSDDPSSRPVLASVSSDECFYSSKLTCLKSLHQ